MIHGIDISFYEPNINWEKLKATGKANFVFIRAGQGLVKDPYFDRHRDGANSVGLPWGSYWFYDPRWQSCNPKRQADEFAKALDGDYGQLPMVGDFEAFYSGPWHGWRKWYDFFEQLKKNAPGKRLAAYTGFYFWRDRGPGSLEIAAHNYFGQYPLWMASYPKPVDVTHTPEWAKLIPLRAWKRWDFWQYNDQDILDGIYGDIPTRPANVDFNFFNGDQAALDAFLEDYTPPPPVESDGWIGTVTASRGVKMRALPSTGSAQLGAAVRQWSTLEIDQLEGDWAHVLKVNGGERVGWMAVRYGGQVLIQVVEQ